MLILLIIPKPFLTLDDKSTTDFFLFGFKKQDRKVSMMVVRSAKEFINQKYSEGTFNTVNIEA